MLNEQKNSSSEHIHKILNVLGFQTPRLAEDLLQHLLKEHWNPFGFEGVLSLRSYALRIWALGAILALLSSCGFLLCPRP